jgi:alkylhydroperoxidase family enzyme
MGVRSAVALKQGATDELLDEVDRYEESPELTDRQKAVLRLADAYLGAPGEVTPERRAALLEELTPGEAVEAVLWLTSWSSDKTMVALGLDLEEPKHQVM